MITIEEINKEILAGKCTMIYYSANTLWWTHSADDLKEATETGREAQDRKLKSIMADPKVPHEQKARMRAMHDMACSNRTIPLDPSGSPLMQMDSPTKWMAGSIAKPEHFGQYGLEAFIKTHHRNCANHCFTSWDEVTEAIRNEKQATPNE